MYHIKLVKGLSYSGTVTATRYKPDVYTEDEAAYISAIQSGYFEDLTKASISNVLGEKPPVAGDVESVSDESKNTQRTEGSFSGMSTEELKAYAARNGIDIGGMKKKAEIIEAIHKAEERAKTAINVLRGQ